uniref:Uncharacterized protein n=1 Tax=Glossina brevipalpis TaxID=37001 RepID=A0A1A9W097_9MUSC
MIDQRNHKLTMNHCHRLKESNKSDANWIPSGLTAITKEALFSFIIVIGEHVQKREELIKCKKFLQIKPQTELNLKRFYLKSKKLRRSNGSAGSAAATGSDRASLKP